MACLSSTAKWKFTCLSSTCARTTTWTSRSRVISAKLIPSVRNESPGERLDDAERCPEFYNGIFCFSADTIEKEMRTLFKIPAEKETRLWNKYMSNTYEQLNKLDSTVQDAGLFHGQVKWN